MNLIVSRQSKRYHTSTDFVLDLFFPKWEHFTCLGAIPMQVYASNIEKTTERVGQTMSRRKG
jgi:hypothetical protein